MACLDQIEFAGDCVNGIHHKVGIPDHTDILGIEERLYFRHFTFRIEALDAFMHGSDFRHIHGVMVSHDLSVEVG